MVRVLGLLVSFVSEGNHRNLSFLNSNRERLSDKLVAGYWGA